MIITDHEHADLPTPFGTMRTYLFRPAAPGRYPGIVLFSEIFQVTGPIRRTAAMLAGHGIVVAGHRSFRLRGSPGWAAADEQSGAEEGHAGKIDQDVAHYVDVALDAA